VQITLTRRHDWSDTAKFIPLEATLKGAREAGMSVGDYIDTVMNNIPGATQAVIDGMKGLGVFANPIHTVVEIGPGSGRYLEKTQRECSPERYEFYETAAPWAAYVEKTYAAIRQPTDGLKLAATADASADLVQAHKVFSGINLRPTLAYWREMARITRSGGFAVFDIVTEECLSPELISRWIDSGFVGAYPAAVPRLACTQYFQSQGFRLVGSFLGRMGPGTTETFVFRKNG
jgi:SAM-dependent methyltransferase